MWADTASLGCNSRRLPLKMEYTLPQDTSMWFLDLRDMLDGSFTHPAHPRFSAKVNQLGRLIAYVTAVHAGVSVDFQPMCWRRPNRQPCEGVLETEMRKDFIHWHCPECGDEGVVTGWRGLMWDMTQFRGSRES